MLKYTTVVGNDDGIASSSRHPEITRRTLEISAGSKSGTNVALKRRAGVKKILARDTREKNAEHLPPITNNGSPGSPQNNVGFHEKKENFHYQNQPVKRKDIRTPYISHVNRISDITPPYVLHTQITNIDPAFNREHSKLSRYSGNVLEYKNDLELRHEPTFSSLGKLPSSSSPVNDKRPRGRYGRQKGNSFNESDLFHKTADIKELTVQSNQIGLYKRAERKPKDTERVKADESFSIRKKIEQFRRWHEEQYKEKIKKLKQEVDHQFEAEHNIISRQVGALRETPTSKNEISVPTQVEKVPLEVSQEKMEEDKNTPNSVSATNEMSKPRSESARTWKTWRNLNDSYAYNDVQKYIKENELMDDEKATWIKKWITEVNKVMKEQHYENIL